MLHELHLENVGVVASASLNLGPGLTVVTGETGAGKTLILTAVQLLTGARADAGVIRAGADRALVQAAFAPSRDHPDWGLEAGEVALITRELRDGARARARIEGQLAPINALADVIGTDVEVHAQHEHVRLARPEVQRALLDRFAGPEHQAVLAEHRTLWARWRAAGLALEQARGDDQSRARELAQLRHEVQEIASAGIDPDADGSIDDRIELLGNAQQVQEAVEAALRAIGDGGAIDGVGNGLAELRRLRLDVPDWVDAIERLHLVVDELQSASSLIRGVAEEAQPDPTVLAELQGRKAMLTDLRRRFGPELADVQAWHDRAVARLDALADEGVSVDEMEVGFKAARTAVDASAASVRRGRAASAKRLAKVVDEQLAELSMPAAQFSVELGESDEPAEHGGDRIEFLLAPNAGMNPVTLAKAASGGERSRVALALEAALADAESATVIVFDEVDAGIGGEVGAAVGEKLARLAATRQVLVVTHLAQVAAFADQHVFVQKDTDGEQTQTSVRVITDDERIAELARMLSGDRATGEAQEHARALLADAQRVRAAD